MGQSIVATASARRAFLAPRNLIAIAFAAVCIGVIASRADGIDMQNIGHAISSVSPAAWAVAIMATVASFLAVGQYDALFHRWLKTGVAPMRAVRSGIAAISLAQMLGMGLATGTIARWRALPELTFGDAWKLTNYVSFSFMAALGLLSALALALTPISGDAGTVTFASLAVVVALLGVVLVFAQPKWLPFKLPPIRLMTQLTALAAVDIGFAALALWMLLPETVELPLVMLFAAFILALGAGLVSGAPGGIGPFELCLLTLLPNVPQPELIAAILAFRLVYYAVPACIGAALLFRPAPQKAAAPEASPPAFTLMRAESACLSQHPDHRLMAVGSGALHVARGADTLVMMGDPVTGGPCTYQAFTRLTQEARSDFAGPAAYKISARSAVVARRAGWQILRLSEEAVLRPAGFSPTGSKFRQLKRKLSHANKAGITVTRGGPLPLSQMASVAKDWAARSGGERGFSMGMFDPEHIEKQRCYLAWQGTELVAFATFHSNDFEWGLDLMRSKTGAPDGAMHALVCTALEDAKKLGINRLSLAAMACARPHPILKKLGDRSGAAGLRQFKMCFRPDTKPLYLAAPNGILLATAALDIALRIRFPDQPAQSDQQADQQENRQTVFA